MQPWPLRPAVAFLSRRSFNKNLRLIQKQIKARSDLHRKDSKIMAVVKADAYGHDLSKIIPELKKYKINEFCVASLEEGVELRKLSKRAKILVLGGTLDWTARAIRLARSQGFELAVNSMESFYHLQKTSIPLHIKLDTGMNRLGIKPEQWGALGDLIAQGKGCVQGLFSHFAVSSGPDFVRQVKGFDGFLKRLLEINKAPPMIHLENSGALFSKQKFKNLVAAELVNRVRPGLALYGYLPGSFAAYQASQLEPVMQLMGKIGQVKHLKKGEGVSYDFLYRAPKAHSIGIVSLGYADGISKSYVKSLSPRILSARGAKAQTAQVCGAICMDMLMLKTSDGAFQEGDQVEFWGKASQRLIRDRVVSPYELNLRVAKRIPRMWTDN